MSGSGERNAEIQASLVGPLEARKVEIVDYDDEWPLLFRREARALEKALGETAIRIEHIGSTSVPDLAAKPVVDILVTVEQVDEATLTPVLVPLGFELRVRESEHLAFRRRDRSVNLHFYPDDSEEVTAYLLFRDHLRVDGGDRALYETVKRRLATQEWPDVNHYADAKGPVIDEILTRARARAT